MNPRTGLVAVLREAIGREERTLERLRSAQIWLQDMHDGGGRNLKVEMIADTEVRIARKLAIIKACEKDR